MEVWFKLQQQHQQLQQQSNNINKTQIDESYSFDLLDSNTTKLNNESNIHHHSCFTKEREIYSDNEEQQNEEDIKMGDKKLSKSKSSSLSDILMFINSKRKTILKGLRFAYKNISSAKDIIDLISSSFLRNKANTPAQLCHLYLINDILYNSQNTNIKYAWIYKELIHNILPQLFHSINTAMRTDDLMKEHISQLMTIWNSWNVFSDEYIIGLAFPVRKLIDDEVVRKYQFDVKERLEKYEDALLEIYSDDSERLKEIALSNGISNKITTEEMISKLVSLKEFLIYKEKEVDSCDDLNKTILKLHFVLDVIRNSYNKLNPLDLDGMVIHETEYEYFDIPLDEAEALIPQVKGAEENKADSSNINKVYGDDIDGEPI